MRTSKIRLLAVAALAAMALAACSSSSKSSSSDTSPSSAPPTTVESPTTTVGSSDGGAAQTTVALADSKFGKILVDSSGMTLYVDENDKPGAPACTGSCLQAWPPLTATGTPTAGAGVTGKLATVTLADGTTQVTIDGSPLYTWMQDAKPGDVTGQDVNGFYVVQASGEKYEESSSEGGDAS